MTAIIGIYKITAPDGKIYIGASTNIKKRWRSYGCKSANSQRKIANSLKKFGKKKHIFEIIEHCKPEMLDERERFFGDKYDVLNPKTGLNSTLPKAGKNSPCMASDTIEMLRAANLGKTSPMKGIKTGKPAWNKGLKTGVPSPNKGRKYSKEVRRRMSEASKGQKAWNKGKKTGNVPPNSKLVLCNETGIYYLSISRAGKIFGIKPHNLRSMLVGKTKNKTSLILV